MFTVTFVLILIALITTVASAMGKAPLWIPVFMLVLLHLLAILPL